MCMEPLDSTMILIRRPNLPVTLGAGRCLLFAYGQLQPRHRPPKTTSQAWPDRVRGLLFDLGRFPAAVNVDRANTWIHGYVIEIQENELTQELDEFEELAKGLYRRIRTTTEAGFDAWIYEYARPLPPQAIGPIDRWPVVGPGAKE